MVGTSELFCSTSSLFLEQCLKEISATPPESSINILKFDACYNPSNTKYLTGTT